MKPQASASWLRGRAWFWVPVAPLLALDLWSKWAAFAFLDERYTALSEQFRRHAVWAEDAAVRFHLVAWRNTGTIWGLGRDFTTPLVVLRIVALVLIVYFAAKLPTRARLQQLVLGIILAGAIGNLYDNLTQPEGGVRDFLLFSASIGGIVRDWPAFNVADSCICVGAITLALLLMRHGQPRAVASAAAGAQPTRGDGVQ